MLGLGSKSSMALSRRAIADLHVVPTFLCPTLEYSAAYRKSQRRRPQASRARNLASTSSSASFPREQANSLQDGMQKDITSTTSVNHLLPSRDESFVKGRERERKHLIDLAVTEEVINDILMRSKEFNSKAESFILMHEAKLLLMEERHSLDSRAQKLVRAIAPKLAFAYLLFGRPTDAIAITQHATQGWKREDEDELRDMWKPVVSLAYTKDLYDESSQIASMLTKYSDLSGNWMHLAQMQSVLRMAEAGQRNKVIERADTLWKAYGKEIEKVPEAVMMIILASQIKRNDVEKVRLTLEAMTERNISISKDVWKYLLWPLIRGKGPSEVMQLLSNFSKDMHLIAEELVSPLTREWKVRDCLRVLRTFGIPTGAQKVKIHTTRPSFEIYSSIIHMFSNLGRPNLAIRFLNLAFDSNCQGNYTLLYFVIASAFRKVSQPQDALHVGAKLMGTSLLDIFPATSTLQLHNHKAVLHPSRAVYAQLLISTSYLSDVTAIVPTTRSILLDMFAQGKEVNPKIRKALCWIVSRLSRTGSKSELIKMNMSLFTRREKLWRVEEYDKEGWRKWTETLQKEGVIDHFAISVWNKLPSIQKEEKVDIEEVLGIPFQGLFREMTANDFVIEETSSEDRIPNKAIGFDGSLSSAGFAMRLRVLAVIRRDFQSALDLYKIMGQNNVESSMHHVAPLIEGLVLANRIKEAHEIKQRALQEFTTNIIPLRVYAALIRGYGQLKDWDGLMYLATEMKEEGIQINNSFRMAFRTARLMKKEQKRLSEKERQTIEKVKPLTQPSAAEENYPMSLQRATQLFQHYHQNRQYLIAQQHISKALDTGLQPDRTLHADLRSSENWLKKNLNLENYTSLRRRQHLSNALELCRTNRARLPRKDPATTFAQIESENREREKLSILLEEALGTHRLWNEAQGKQDKGEQAAAAAATTTTTTSSINQQ